MIRDTDRSVRATWLGLIAGLALGFAGIIDGFVGFLVVLVLGAVGLAVGLAVDGRIDPLGWMDRDRRDRR